MDYDDNDLQSQNLQLAGEGSTKFPPVLRPYDLSKFDFDESLQGNLRFDSLVETEVFLGIESNEDNQWIDAFSRGDTSIEFGSTAAESCSISRHVNVWSEATSSESVEMLLKSVGQEEFIPRQTVNQESDACNELDCLVRQMDPDLKPDDNNEFSDVTNLQPLGDIHQSLSESKEDLRMEVQSHEGELSIDGSSINPEQNDSHRNMDLPVSGGGSSALTDDKINSINQSEAETVDDDSHSDKTQDDSSVSGLQTNVREDPTQTMADVQQGSLQSQTHKEDLGSSMMNKEAVNPEQKDSHRNIDLPVSEGSPSAFTDAKINSINQVEVEAVDDDSHGDKTQDDSSVSGLQTNVTEASMQNMADEQQGPLQTQTNKEDLESSVMIKEAVNPEQNDSHRNIDLSVSEGTPSAYTDAKINSINQREVETVADDSHGDKAQDDSSVSRLQTNVTEASIQNTGSEVMDEQSTLNKPNLLIKDDFISKGHVVEVSNSSGGICPNLLQNVDVVVKTTCGESSVTKENELLNPGGHTDTEILSSKSEASTFTEEENNINFIGEQNNDSRKIDNENFDQDVSVNDKESERIRSDSRQIHCEVDQSHLADKGVGSSTHSASFIETESTTSLVSINVSLVNSSASQVISENITSTSCEIIDVSPPCGKVVSIHEDTGHNITPVGSSSVDGKGESAAEVSEEAVITTSAGSSQQDPAACFVMGTEKRQLSDASRQLLCETTSDCLHNVGDTSRTVDIGEPQGTIDNPVFQECAKEIDMPQLRCESKEKQDGSVTISFVKDDKENVQENHDKSSSNILGDGVLLENKASISSASLPDSSIELHETVASPAHNTYCPSSKFGSPTQTEKDQNQVKSSANQSPPTSELINIGAKIILSTAQDMKGNSAYKSKRSLTPEVNPVPDLSKKDITDVNQEDVGKRHPVAVSAVNNASTAVEGSPLTSGLGPSKTESAGDISNASPLILDREVACSVPKATPERKTRRASNKTAGKESRRRSRVKDTTPAQQSEIGDKSTVSLSPSPVFQLMQSNEVQRYGHIDPNSTKPFALVNASTSSLPDLNTSASPPVLFHQPFTDLQQVQLRAQIIVYGALIQGTAPDEAHMISAFGGPDGGRSIWESAWRACMERQHCKKYLPVNPETPLPSRSGARSSDSAVKQSAVEGKGISSPLGRASGKATPPTVNPMIPLSSPLWSLPTPSCDSLQRSSVLDYHQALASLHPYQTPPPRSFVGHSTSWMPQAPLRGPWIASPSPAPDNSMHLSVPPVSDAIKLSSIKGSSLPPSSGIKNATSGLPASSAGSLSIIVGTASLLDANSVAVTPARHSSDPKPKKRKKVTVSEDLGQMALQSPTAVGSNISSSVSISIPVGNVPIATAEKSVVSVSPLVDHLNSDHNVEKRILSDESLMKIKEAKVHAEEAAALSAAAINHSLEIWNQLDKHKSSGLIPDIEAKLASAAVAVAAAAAVAKAAAAAANVASNAAVQAKLMADEALISSGYENASQSNRFFSEGTSNMGKATPVSILKGATGTNSPASIIVSVKEAVKRRVEAASAATKRAENMDAIVKAAELAAEAVSQAGKIVTMGDPLPLSDLVEAGPEGCWKSARESSQQVVLSKDVRGDRVNIENVDIPEISHTHKQDISSGGISTSINIDEKNSKEPIGHKFSNLVKHVDVVPGSEPQALAASFTVSDGSENLEENNIREGSLVEVFKDEEAFKAAWFTANTLTLKDGKAYVCYTSLVAVEGAGPLKEWISLEGEGGKPPRIRVSHPLTSLHYEGTRKRRRAAMGDYSWAVGDRVDACIQESWREGVITEKNKKDETAFTVHFPTSGETSVVKAWHLRPSRIWKDGKWIEASKVIANDSSVHEGDTPHEKRPKRGSSPVVELKGKDKTSKSIDAVESANPDESRLLSLTDNEKVFNIGKSGKNENKPETHRMVRTGLQKEGSRVVFGVPKPGKKRKFMDVSKHYVAHGSSKINDSNDSVKLANFLVPQGSGSRGWKNNSKNDTIEKLGADSKPKNFRSGKPLGFSSRVIPPKENSSNASQSESQEDRAPSSSASDGLTKVPILFSSLARSTDALPTKKTSTSRASKGKLAPAGGKLVKADKASNDNHMNSTSDVIEPRRSNRRIQPTSRLLEGLQSSLIVSKIPSASHNRNAKGNN